MVTFVIAAFAVGLVAGFRLGPLVVVPLAVVVIVLGLALSIDIAGSAFLAAVAAVVALNVGYLAGALVTRLAARSARFRSVFPSGWFIP